MEAAKSTRVEDAYARLKDEIRTNRLPPGFQAPEPEIAIKLGMSRTPVREALIRLEAEGLVELVPRRGARVLPIRPADMREIYEILTALEPDAAARLAEGMPSPDAFVPLDEATSDMERALEAQDLDAWAEADDRFHRTLLALQGNRRLASVVTALYDQAHRVRIVTMRMRGLPKQSTAEHREIVSHLQAGEPEAARIAFRNHRERAGREMLGLLERYKLSQL
ncbi:MAG: GntR family transcriptional regulator [Pseudomonadota bacterium]